MTLTDSLNFFQSPCKNIPGLHNERYPSLGRFRRHPVINWSLQYFTSREAELNLILRKRICPPVHDCCCLATLRPRWPAVASRVVHASPTFGRDSILSFAGIYCCGNLENHMFFEQGFKGIFLRVDVDRKEIWRLIREWPIGDDHGDGRRHQWRSQMCTKSLSSRWRRLRPVSFFAVQDLVILYSTLQASHTAWYKTLYEFPCELKHVNSLAGLQSWKTMQFFNFEQISMPISDWPVWGRRSDKRLRSRDFRLKSMRILDWQESRLVQQQSRGKESRRGEGNRTVNSISREAFGFYDSHSPKSKRAFDHSRHKG
jgi:hypothetical protein